MTKYLLVLVIFVSLPSITARDQHISISIFEGGMLDAVNRWRRRIVNAFSGAALMLVGLCMWRYANLLLQNQDVIGASLLPLAPAGYAVSTLSVVTGLAFFARLRSGKG